MIFDAISVVRLLSSIFVQPLSRKKANVFPFPDTRKSEKGEIHFLSLKESRGFFPVRFPNFFALKYGSTGEQEKIGSGVWVFFRYFVRVGQRGEQDDPNSECGPIQEREQRVLLRGFP